jgi:hypothetical protein
MASRTQIANDTLLGLALEEVTDSLESSPRARAINAIFDKTLDEVLASHPWNCAKARAVIAKDAAAPTFGFANQYTLPADRWCLRAWRLDPDYHGDDAKFKVEGRKLLTDEGDPIYLQYIARVADIEELAPGIAWLLSMTLAWKLAWKLTGKLAVKADMEKAVANARLAARSQDGQEDTPDPLPESSFLMARY